MRWYRNQNLLTNQDISCTNWCATQARTEQKMGISWCESAVSVFHNWCKKLPDWAEAWCWEMNPEPIFLTGKCRYTDKIWMKLLVHPTFAALERSGNFQNRTKSMGISRFETTVNFVQKFDKVCDSRSHVLWYASSILGSMGTTTHCVVEI